MRRTVIAEESQKQNRPTRYRLTPLQFKDKQEARLAVRAEVATARPSTKSTRGGLHLLVRLNILLLATLASIAALAMIAVNQAGVALGNLPSQLDFKATYNTNNLNQAKALALLKLGNRKGAMALVLTLPHQNKADAATEPEFRQIRYDLIEAQVRAGEFADALKVAAQIPHRIGDVITAQLNQEGLAAALANVQTLPVSLQLEKESAIVTLGGYLGTRRWVEARGLLSSLETTAAKDILIDNLMRTFPQELPLNEGLALAKQASTTTVRGQVLSSLGGRFLNPLDEAKCVEILGHINTKTDGIYFLSQVVGQISTDDPQRAFEIYRRFRSQDDLTLLQKIGQAAVLKQQYTLAEQVADIIKNAPLPRPEMGKANTRRTDM